jgi:hypothetical protein
MHCSKTASSFDHLVGGGEQQPDAPDPTCLRAASGRAIATPPCKVMNSRLFTR